MKNLSYKIFFDAISNRTRLSIIEQLKKGPRNVSNISKALNFEQSRVSHNLKCLYDCGFVTISPNGKERIYSLNKDTVLPLLNLIDNHIEKYLDHLIKCRIIRPAKK